MLVKQNHNYFISFGTNCGWSASLLKGSGGFSICPVCRKDSIEVIPVSDRERYILVLKGEKGFEIDFDVDK